MRLGSGTSFPVGVTIDARGGTISGWEGASGTVYTETADQAGGKGHILVENGHWAAMRAYGVQLPPSNGTFDDTLTQASLSLIDRGRLQLRADLELDSMTVGANALLDLNGRTLLLNAATIDGIGLKGGEHSAASLGLSQVIDASAGGDGRIIIPPKGSLFLLR